MTVDRARRFVTLVAVGLAAVAASQCGSKSPTGPTSIVTVSSVSLNATSVAAGTATAGTVTLTAPAPTAGETVTLSSDNAAAATVQNALTIASGAMSGAFTVDAIGAGTATISAALNGTSRQSPMLTITAGPLVTLASLDLSTPSVVGGHPVIARVTLDAPAPSGGAAVQLTARDPVTAPATITIDGGSMTTTFALLTRAVGGTMARRVTASYGGVSQSAMLAVTPPTTATANFGVTGPSETETCTLTSGGSTLDCTFNGSTSTAPGAIVAWSWSYGVSGMLSQTTTGPVLSMPAFNCNLMPAPPLPSGAQWLPMTVQLTVRDDRGNVSPKAINSGIRLFPQGACGY